MVVVEKMKYDESYNFEREVRIFLIEYLVYQFTHFLRSISRTFSSTPFLYS